MNQRQVLGSGQSGLHSPCGQSLCKTPLTNSCPRLHSVRWNTANRPLCRRRSAFAGKIRLDRFVATRDGSRTSRSCFAMGWASGSKGTNHQTQRRRSGLGVVGPGQGVSWSRFRWNMNDCPGVRSIFSRRRLCCFLVGRKDGAVHVSS